MTSHEGLTPDQLAAFHRDGYLIVPDALPPATVSALLDETRRLLDGLDLSTHPLTRFRTGGEDGADHVGDEYFLTSGDKIVCLLPFRILKLISAFFYGFPERGRGR